MKGLGDESIKVIVKSRVFLNLCPAIISVKFVSALLLNGMDTMRNILFFQIFSVCLVLVLSGTHPDGFSKITRTQDALGNYKFSYDISNPEGEHFRKEGTDHLGRVIGSYGLKHADGTHRIVEYVADKNGFRAEIHSNEPGVISSESNDASISKLHSDLPLAVAATSEDKFASNFGTRLSSDSSRISYINEDDNKSSQHNESEPKKIKQKNFEDYRPENPSAYYPSAALDTGRSLQPSSYSASGVSLARSQTQNPSEESRSLDVYLPPINPHSVIRRPPYFASRERSLNPTTYASTSRRPYTPPYGGFDNNPIPADRRPEHSIYALHGSLGRDNFESPLISTPSYGYGNSPSDDSTLSKDFISSGFPLRSNFPPLSNLPDGPLSIPPRSVPGMIFRPPSYNVGLNPRNFVLRAVPIPNGIQAVRVDPETGNVYDRLIYPLYIKDGQPVYDRNVIFHRNDNSDDAIIRNHNPSYFDFAFQHRPAFRTIRTLGEDFKNVTRHFNQTFNPLTLSIPTARDLEWVQRQLSQVEGFDKTRFENPSVFQNAQYENNKYPPFDDFDDDSGNENVDNEALKSRLRNSDYFEDSLSPEPRLFDRLTPEDTKEIASESNGETEV